MLNPFSYSRLSCSFYQPHLLCAPRLASRTLIPYLHIIHRSTLRERKLAILTKQVSKRGPQMASPRVLTLRPERMSTVGQQIIDLSDTVGAMVHTVASSPLQCIYDSKNQHADLTPFPKNTRGVFYYHRVPYMPEFYAGVRFRLCDNLAQFERGRDLLDPRGDVWGYKILQVVKHTKREGFLSLLRAENLVDEELINDINKLDITHNVRRYQYSLSEPFYANLARRKGMIKYITRTKVINLLLPGNTFVIGTGISAILPMTGFIRARFELSNLREHKKLGPTLVVRVLDILELITVDPLYNENAISIPVPGKLLYKVRRGKKHVVHIPLKLQRMADDLLELVKASWP